MSSVREQVSSEISQLILDGTMMWIAESGKSLTSGEREKLIEQLRAPSKPGASSGKSAASKAPKVNLDANIQNGYQGWYSKALRIVEQLLPDRYQEFRDLYRPEKRKEITVETYGISDYLNGISISRFGEPAFDTSTVTVTKFQIQIEILRTASDRLGAIVSDITTALQGEIADSEISSAYSLAKARQLRSAGVIAGVVLERHLKLVASTRGLKYRTKPTLANLNDLLKESGAYDVPTWRRIQHVGDIRNLCAHSGEREPTAVEVKDMIQAVEALIKTVF